MKNKLLIGVAFLILSSFIISNPVHAYIYQENPNSVNYTGTWDEVGKIYDGDWDTYTRANNNKTAYLYINYTKPYDVTSVIWQIKSGPYGDLKTTNHTLPSDCFNSNELQFRINNSVPYPELDPSNITWSCWNGTEWKLILNYTDTLWTYASEEGVYWSDFPRLTNCSDPYNVTSLIFSHYHESNLNPINASLDITFDSESDNYSFSFTENETHSVCITAVWESYVMDAFGVYYSDTHSQRSYYLLNGTLSNSTQAVNIYSLNTSESKAVVVYIKDENGLYVEDVYVKVQRYYPGTNTYKTVAYLKTDEDGKDMTYLYLNDVYYKFILEQAGVIVNEISPRTITDTVDDPEEITFSLTGTDLDYFQYGDISAGCTYNNATWTLRCTVSDSSNFMVESCLKTDKLGILSPENVNETCSYDSAVTHVHIIGNNTGEYKYVLTISTPTNTYNDITDTIVINKPESDFGEWGLLVAFLMVMVCGGLGMAYPPAGGILAVIGLVLGMSINMLEVAGASIIGLLIVAFIYLWKGRS